MSITFITRQYNSLLNLKYGVFGMNIKKSGYTQKIFEILLNGGENRNVKKHT